MADKPFPGCRKCSIDGQGRSVDLKIPISHSPSPFSVSISMCFSCSIVKLPGAIQWKQTKLSFDLFKHMYLVDATATAKDTDTATRAVPLFSISTAN